MNVSGQSDNPVVPAKPPDKAGAAEVVEERGLAEGNTDSAARPGPRAGQSVSQGLDRVREAARRGRKARFTELLHHVHLDRLRAAYRALSPMAAPGVDGVTWADYGKDLEANLQGLLTGLHRGSYRARPLAVTWSSCASSMTSWWGLSIRATPSSSSGTCGIGSLDSLCSCNPRRRV
jgi:RNA-directed DNA polymerase